MRLWTTLIDEQEYPAQELLELYALRWEHEIFYKELKLHMRGNDVLHSHTPETAAQEVAALLMACSIIAQERCEAAKSGNIQPLSISFLKTLDKMNSLWAVFEGVRGTADRRDKTGDGSASQRIDRSGGNTEKTTKELPAQSPHR